MAAIVIFAASISSAPVSRATAAEMGVYKGAGTTGTRGIPAFEAWNGGRVPRALDFFARSSWSEMLSEGTWAAKSWGPWSGHRWKVTFSVPMLPDDKVSTLAKGATGAYNGHFRRIAEMLVANGHRNAVLRLGWEFNGGWYPWSAARCPSCFVNYWRQIVTTMRSVPGAAFKFDWNPNLGYLQIPAQKVYPGDAYVDVIGLDVYNEWWSSADRDPVRRWSTLMNKDNGLAWHAAFARQHGKPISFPEWGTGTRPDGHGGGDDPYFIQQMRRWISANNVLYHNYWDYAAPDYNSKLSGGRLPKAGAMFRQLF
jgi:hypothetical protein